jgi:hypothetical protein
MIKPKHANLLSGIKAGITCINKCSGPFNDNNNNNNGNFLLDIYDILYIH